MSKSFNLSVTEKRPKRLCAMATGCSGCWLASE